MSDYSSKVITDTLYLIKTTGNQEFNAFYTVKNAIVFPGIIFTSAKIFPWLPYFSNFIEKKLIHEMFHIFSTNHFEKRLSLYEVFGFFPIENLELPKEIEKQLITNPADKGVNYKIELQDLISGEMKNYCLLIMSKYPTWVGYKDFSARVNVMLDYLDPRLVENEKHEDNWIVVNDSINKPITIPVYNSAPLLKKIAVKINAIQSPEEIITKSYVVLMQSLIENKVSENQSATALEKLKILENKLLPSHYN